MSELDRVKVQTWDWTKQNNSVSLYSVFINAPIANIAKTSYTFAFVMSISIYSQQ